MMYHCVLHMQTMSLMSVASTVIIHCITMFVPKAFNLDCPYMAYIITSVIIRVLSAAVIISMSARKLFRNDLNFKFLLGFLILVLSGSEYSFYFSIGLPDLTVFGGLSRLGLISKVSIEKGKICSWVVQFCETGMANFSIMSSK